MRPLNGWRQKWIYFKKDLTGSSLDSKIFKRQQIDIKLAGIVVYHGEW